MSIFTNEGNFVNCCGIDFSWPNIHISVIILQSCTSFFRSYVSMLFAAHCLVSLNVSLFLSLPLCVYDLFEDFRKILSIAFSPSGWIRMTKMVIKFEVYARACDFLEIRHTDFHVDLIHREFDCQKQNQSTLTTSKIAFFWNGLKVMWLKVFLSIFHTLVENFFRTPSIQFNDHMFC